MLKSAHDVAAQKPGPVLARKPWAGGALRFQKEIASRFALDARDIALLKKNGFALSSRALFPSYGLAYHELHQSELPIYVSADSIFNAIYISNDAIIKKTEETLLGPALSKAVLRLRDYLKKNPDRYPAPVRANLDLYLTIALSLLNNQPEAGLFAPGPERVTPLLEKIHAAAGLDEIELFGRRRVVDFSQFTPRGHYTDGLEAYFKAAMWLSRIEFNIVSRSCRSSHPGTICDKTETDAETLTAMALADLIVQSGANRELETVLTAWTMLAGQREDIPMSALTAFMAREDVKNFDNDAARRLRLAIGAQYPRTVNMHSMPEETTELPAIATLLGPRLTPDLRVQRPLVDPSVPGRKKISVFDVAYSLGSDRSAKYLESELKFFPRLQNRLAQARQAATGIPRTELYSHWYAAIRAIAAQHTGQVPGFMERQAYADLKLNSTVAAFGQIRHNYVLMAGQEYFFGGCRSPDGYVEPAAATYAELLGYAHAGAKLFQSIDPANKIGASAYFERTRSILTALLSISQRETHGQALTRVDRNFLAQIAALTQGTTGAAPGYDGWYFRLYFEPQLGIADAAFISDYYTSPPVDRILYAGVKNVALGFFVIDSNGGARLMAGPVASAFHLEGPINKRYADADVRSLKTLSPWLDAYRAPEQKVPSLNVNVNCSEEGARKKCEIQYETREPLRLKVSLLDHHRKIFKTAERHLKPGSGDFTMEWRGVAVPEMIHLQAGDFHEWKETAMGGVYFTYLPDRVQ